MESFEQNGITGRQDDAPRSTTSLSPPVMVEADAQNESQDTSSAQLDGNRSSHTNRQIQYMMDLSPLDPTTTAALLPEESDAPQRLRKLTGTSDATSITAASSFLDETGLEDGGYAYTGSGNDLVKPRLDSLDEGSGLEEDGCDGTDEPEKEPDSCCYLWFKRILLFLVVFCLLALFVVLIGAAVEKRSFANKEGTAHLYELPEVCGAPGEDLPLTNTTEYQTLEALSSSSSSSVFTTFDSAQDAHDAGLGVAHCGNCGSCSTSHDLNIMAQTTESLTRDSTRCAFKIFLGRQAVEKCMEERVGFTPACEDCWLDNIACSFRSCKFTCIKYKMFRQDNNNHDVNHSLNDCLKCDERMCGEAFTVCSGSNRRRMGIISDIGRDADTEQCHAVDADWSQLDPEEAVATARQAEDELFD